ncbi:MAG: DUF502 domain-containing protein [Chloroflexi bacterium]|nr:DUF502 domain-containing protein [Chloroflexota bacterium]
MTDTHSGQHGSLRRKIGRQFLAGLLVVAPIGVTIWILLWILFTIDNFVQPIIRTTFGRNLPGAGFGITVILVYLVGVIASHVIGHRIIRYGESLLSRVPVFRYLYLGIKQFLESFAAPGKAGFSQVVLVEFPRKGMKAMGFITSELSDNSGGKMFSVFIPTTPNPTTGFLEILRQEEVIRTDISVEEALRFIVSVGATVAPGMKAKLAKAGQSLPPDIPSDYASGNLDSNHLQNSDPLSNANSSNAERK